MDKAYKEIQELAEAHCPQPFHIELLPLSGSVRRYYRLYSGKQTWIGTYGDNVKENEAFIYFSRNFHAKGLPVPDVLHVNEACTAYIQTDLGQRSLLTELEEHGYTPEVKALFALSLQQLAALQVRGHEGLDYNKCLTAKEFGKQAILSDLLYFKYYFLDALQLPYDKQAMLDDFDALSTYLTRTEYKFFMFRDFQSRNVIISQGKPYFIDYQGGMLGAPQYDAASMIWQARADLPAAWKDELLEGYMNALDEELGKTMDRNIFSGQYFGYVLIRLLQVLGAYGFRGLFERKAQFLSSIPLALRNLHWFLHNQQLSLHVPEFWKMLKEITTDEIIERYDPPKAGADCPLKVELCSFSYKRNGYPSDESDNGGGFVFDCRGIFNPGRFEAYKTLSGKDKDVIDFLEQKTRMPQFLNSVFDMVDISVEDYIKRGFTKLMISFGCTGGQHRSVYAAEQTARHLRNKYRVNTQVTHLNTNNWVRAGLKEQQA